MKTRKNLFATLTGWLATAALFSLFLQLAHAKVLDNFNDNTKTDWTDFTFVPGFGLPSEAGGELRFELPPAGQAIFTGTQKTSQIFDLREGRTIEFRVDITAAGAKDSFAVLSFIPVGNSPGTLAGYGFAKSTTDVLLTKGIGKYFVADDGPTAELKNENITLVLKLTAQNGSVVMNGKVLDKENSDAVIWERTVVDSPAADVLANGEDSPAAPFIASGYFTLFCYADFDRNAPEDPYRIHYDNAESFVTDTFVLDDFDDNSKTDWKDFTFVPGFGLPMEKGGQFQFQLPPAGQAIFTASQKTSRAFELSEGERLTFSVDVVQGGAKDSFAVLGFIPVANSPGTLAGYGFAKSTTDVLLTKGIGKYFVAHAGPEAHIKNENITLVLTLTARDGSVTINGQVLDKDNNNAVLWERTVVDTPAADVLADGEDSPAAPFLTSGYFTLYCYADFDSNAPEDPYRVHYDNAIAGAPPVTANLPPQIIDVSPAEFANFLPASTQISFKVTDDKPIPADKISVTINGTTFTPSNGLTVSAAGNASTATLGNLAPNTNYAVQIDAEDAEGAGVSRTLYFDTFAQNSLVIELEDYNFSGGQFIDNPVPIVEGAGPQADAYGYQAGFQDIDFNDTRTAPRFQDAPWRPDDPVRMQRSRDHARAKYTAAGGSAAEIHDYDVIDIASDEWLNYTRTFPAGTYEVYLRQALVNMMSGESTLELVTGDRTQPNQTTRMLGSFLGERTGFQYRNFPLTDGTGKNKIIVRLSGVETLRLRQLTANTADTARYQTYLILIPVADPGVQPAAITAISPAAGAAIETVSPAIRVEIQNRDTSVRPDSIRLEINGRSVMPEIALDANGAVVTSSVAPLPPSGAVNLAKIQFVDSANTTIASEWSFVVNYNSLNVANRRGGPGLGRGFNLRVVQAPAGSGLANDLQRAEDQLAPNSTIPVHFQTNTVVQVVNQGQTEGDTGLFPGDILVPGIDFEFDGNDDFAVEITGWLELNAGVHRFGVVTDDGYKVSSNAALADKEPVLGHHNGGPANETFDFVVPASGFYPIRMIWYERGGNAYAELFSVDLANGDRILVNDPENSEAIKAFLDAEVGAPTQAFVQVESASAVTGPYTLQSNAVVDAATKRIRLGAGEQVRFFRIRVEGAAAAPRISGIQIEGADVVLTYE